MIESNQLAESILTRCRTIVRDEIGNLARYYLNPRDHGVAFDADALAAYTASHHVRHAPPPQPSSCAF
jgi:hypothetical protein